MSRTVTALFTQTHPASAYLWALVLAPVIPALAWFLDAPLDAEMWRRTIYVAAGVLLWDDLIWLARLRPGTHARDPLRWFHAYAMGGFWGSFMLIATWDTGDTLGASALTWGIAGLAFGGIMAATVKGGGAADDAHPFDLSRIDDPTSFERRWLLMMPAFALVMVAVFTVFQPAGGWAPAWYFWLVLLTLSSAGTVRLRADASPLMRLFRPRHAGLALLLLGLLAI
ncbi:MAG: hypothetical protein AAFQ79_17515 [Pseudomonadota bacterium]